MSICSSTLLLVIFAGSLCCSGASIGNQRVNFRKGEAHHVSSAKPQLSQSLAAMSSAVAAAPTPCSLHVLLPDSRRAAGERLRVCVVLCILRDVVSFLHAVLSSMLDGLARFCFRAVTFLNNDDCAGAVEPFLMPVHTTTHVRFALSCQMQLQGV